MTRAKTGIARIDGLMQGGIPSNASVVLQGPSGFEKESIAFNFVAEGLRNGESVIVVLSSISPDDFRREMRNLKVDTAKHENESFLKIIDWYSFREKNVVDIEEEGSVLRCSVDLVNIGIALSRAIAEIRETSAKRAVIDVLSPALNEYQLQKVYGFAQSTKAKLEKMGFTSLFLVEKDMHDSVTLSTLLQPFDGVIDLERTREGDKIVRKVAVLSMRDTVTDSRYVPLDLAVRERVSRVLEEEKKVAAEKTSRMKELESAVRNNPKDSRVWFDLGTHLLLKGEREKALRCFNIVLRLDPQNVGALTSKANALKELGRISEATECYKKAIDISKSQAAFPSGGVTPQREISQICPSCKKPGKAGQEFCEYCGMSFRKRMVKGMDVSRILRICLIKLQRNPDDADALFVRGAALEKIGNHKKAIEALNELTRTDPEYPGVWVLKTKVYANLGDKKMASLARERAEQILAEQYPQPEIPFSICHSCGKKVPRGKEICPFCGADMRTPSYERKEKLEKVEEVKKHELLIGREETRELDVERGIEPPHEAREGKRASIEERGLTTAKAASEKKKKKGLTNGLVNGLGRVNGLTNGLVNGLGRVNGLTNGLVNGLGRVNGLTNGLVNGLRSLKSGFRNGITNGLGLTNGLGGGRFSREAKKNKWELYLIPLVAIVMLLGPLLYPSSTVHWGAEKIRIDGEFNDWKDVQKTEVRSDPLINPSVDIVEVSVEDNGNYLSFYLMVRGNILEGNPPSRKGDVVHIFIDVDRQSGTGYLLNGMGADFMIEIAGMEGHVYSSQLKKFDNSREQSDWNAWLNSGTVASAASSSELEVQLYWQSIAREPCVVDAFFHTRSANGDEDFSDMIVSNSGGTLLVTQKSTIASDVISGSNQPILELDLEAYGRDVTLRGISVHVTGTALSSDVAYLKLVDESGTPLSQRIFLSDLVSFSCNEVVEEGYSRRYFVLADLASSDSGNTLGAIVLTREDILTENGTSTLITQGSARDVGYVEKIPAEPMIDGGFSDWKFFTPDPIGEESTGGEANVDISAYDANIWGTNAFFYMRVSGDLLYGTPVPIGSPYLPQTGVPVTDSDMDSVPDDLDGPGGSGIFRFDFDNDGISDVETGNDVDGDGVTDYPLGPDYWLNTTIPLNFPQPYAGKVVSRFIGPVEKPPLSGDDFMRIFIDADNSSKTGYALRGIGADVLVEMSGRERSSSSARVLEFDGDSPGKWEWRELGMPNLALGTTQVELSIPRLPLGITNESMISFEARDVWGNVDSGDELLGGSRNNGGRGLFFFYPPERESGTRASFLVHTSTSAYATAMSQQRKLIYDGTYWWAFYYNGTDTVYEYSSDGQTWTNTPNKAFTTGGVLNASAWYNDTGSSKVVYIVGDTSTATTTVYVRRGTISGTTITWGTEYTVVVCGSGKSQADKKAFISQDSQGYLWIITSQRETSVAPKYNIAATRSTYVDDVSTWDTYTLMLSTNYDNTNLYPIILPLSNQDMYAVWYRDGYIEGKKYTEGSGWGSVTSIGTTSSGVANKTMSAVVDSSYYIHLIYANETGRINYTEYTTSWGTPSVIDSSANNEYPTISIDNSTDYLYAFWISSTYQIVGKKFTGSSWSDIQGIEVNTNEKDWLTSIYNVTAMGKICWEWTQGASSPYDVRFELIPEFDEIFLPILMVLLFVLWTKRRRK